MNASHSQGQQGQTAHQAAHNRLFKPEMMRDLPDQFSAEEKKKWELGLAHLYQQMKDHPPESSNYQNAKTKVMEFTQNLNKKLQVFRVQSREGQARISNQGVQQNQGQGTGNTQSQVAGLPQKAQASSGKPSEQVLNYITNFPYVLPPHIVQGTPEAQKWLTDAKNRLCKALYAMEAASMGIRSLENMLKERVEQGNPLSPGEQKDFTAKKEALQKQHSEAKRYTETFRKTQEQLVSSAAAQQNQPGGNANSGPPRPAANAQQTQNSSIPSIQSVNSVIQSTKNHQINAGNAQGVVQHTPQTEQASSGQATSVTSHPSLPQTAVNQNVAVKVEGGNNQIQLNTAVASAPHVQINLSRTQNSPHSSIPQSAASTGAPRPLTHQAALTQAARTYSSGQTSATSVIGSHAHPPVPRETSNINTSKMPIPKQLPPRAIGPPPPVAMQPSRPTLSGGPSNAGGGALGQPALQKTPGFNLEGEGERIMNKKKLDELVRQVTGGGDGLDSGEALTPEVEDCVLSISDEFVDQVITAACKCAKARGSKTLEIRDIQLILERNYNIRIPGYASDEIRTVRKFQPAQGWIAKMSAIQAAKVTGGKPDL